MTAVSPSMSCVSVFPSKSHAKAQVINSPASTRPVRTAAKIASTRLASCQADCEPPRGSRSSSRANAGRNAADSAPSPNSRRARFGIKKANEKASHTGPSPNNRADATSRNIPKTRLSRVDEATTRKPAKSRGRPISGRGPVMRLVAGRKPGSRASLLASMKSLSDSRLGLNRPRPGESRRLAQPNLRAVEVELLEDRNHALKRQAPFLSPNQNAQVLHAGLRTIEDHFQKQVFIADQRAEQTIIFRRKFAPATAS